MQCIHAPRMGKHRVFAGSRGRSFLPPQFVLPLQAGVVFSIGAPRQRVCFCGKSHTKVVAMPAASLRHIKNYSMQQNSPPVGGRVLFKSLSPGVWQAGHFPGRRVRRCRCCSAPSASAVAGRSGKACRR